MKYGLSPRQKKIFDFIKSYMKKKPVAPTYEEMKCAAGLKANSGVHKIVLN